MLQDKILMCVFSRSPVSTKHVLDLVSLGPIQVRCDKKNGLEVGLKASVTTLVSYMISRTYGYCSRSAKQPNKTGQTPKTQSIISLQENDRHADPRQKAAQHTRATCLSSSIGFNLIISRIHRRVKRKWFSPFVTYKLVYVP